MLVQQMAVEWGPDGIRCNCVSPGPTLTPMTATAYSNPKLKQQRESNIPLRRLGRPEDVANAIAQSYIQHTYNNRFKSSASLATFMEQQLDGLRAKMERSGGALVQFERRLPFQSGR